MHTHWLPKSSSVRTPGKFTGLDQILIQAKDCFLPWYNLCHYPIFILSYLDTNNMVKITVHDYEGGYIEVRQLCKPSHMELDNVCISNSVGFATTYPTQAKNRWLCLVIDYSWSQMWMRATSKKLANYSLFPALLKVHFLVYWKYIRFVWDWQLHFGRERTVCLWFTNAVTLVIAINLTYSVFWIVGPLNWMLKSPVASAYSCYSTHQCTCELSSSCPNTRHLNHPDESQVFRVVSTCCSV